eukprot:6064150-Pyramimonas_sp.AAC.1
MLYRPQSHHDTGQVMQQYSKRLRLDEGGEWRYRSVGEQRRGDNDIFDEMLPEWRGVLERGIGAWKQTRDKFINDVCRSWNFPGWDGPKGSWKLREDKIGSISQRAISELKDDVPLLLTTVTSASIKTKNAESGSPRACSFRAVRRRLSRDIPPRLPFYDRGSQVFYDLSPVILD